MTQQQRDRPDQTMKWTMILGGGFALLCVGALGAGGAMVYASAQKGASAGPRVIMGSVGAQPDIAGSVGVPDSADGYVPTSVYVEDGADSDVQVMGFGGKNDDGGGGRLSDHTIQNTILSHQNELIQCYAEGLQSDPELAGRVDFHFRVAGDGHVAMVKVTRSGLRDKGTEDCFVRQARAWSFPSTGGGALTKFDTDFNFVTE